MRIAAINSVHYGSTGKIMLGIAENGSDKHDFRLYYPKGRHNRIKVNENCIMFGGQLSEDLHIFLGRVTGLQGYFSKRATLKLIRQIKSFRPDVLHLHNLHNSYINIPLLFEYIKCEEHIRVVWTLHDCWAFTGHCPHFEMIGCDRWKDHCVRCPQYREYPQSYVDISNYMHKKKKEWFTGIPNLTIVTPSVWLQERVKESFLGSYPSMVIKNGIDLTVFHPVHSCFRKQHKCESKKIILGVAFGWNEKKGLDVFIELAKRMDDNYKIVLVGTDKFIDKMIPENIISIHRTNNQIELAEIYSAADVFVNPTREEVLGMVNLEALACGTPVITFDSGGSPECVDDTCGVVVEKNNIDRLESEIYKITNENIFSEENCTLFARNFDFKEKYNDYLRLYENRAKI